ncbi:MAG TPA: hypothetical protein VGQ20_15360, partial [Acidimicrobiales bacterium]|nr:hypothetical protein [Acidimicrobiales bacterium]
MAPARADGTRGPRIALALALVFEALGRAGSIGDSDGWWHFRTGKLILATHAVPRTDPYSWTAPGERWHPNAWLSDTVYALVRRAGGLAGIAWLRTLFVPAFGLALHGLARVRGARPWPSAVVAAVGTLAIYPFVAERPQLFSFLLLPAVIVVTERALSGSARALTLLGVLFV